LGDKTKSRGFVRRVALDRGLNKVKEMVLELSGIAKEAVKLSIEALKEKSREKIEKVYELEKRSDVLNMDIEDECLTLAALQQPVARDLRFIASMMRISNNYERICDLAQKIAYIAEKTIDKPLLKPLIDVPRMGKLVIEMLEINEESIRTGDTSMLEMELKARDDEIDLLYSQTYNELVGYMVRIPHRIDDAIDLLFVAKHLERMGDLVAKSAARLVYIEEGRRVWIK